jgi:hypothetical protein
MRQTEAMPKKRREMLAVSLLNQLQSLHEWRWCNKREVTKVRQAALHVNRIETGMLGSKRKTTYMQNGGGTSLAHENIGGRHKLK